MASPGMADFLARAAAYKANARRATGRYREAKSFFEFARYVVRAEGATDPLLYAELDWSEGAFASEQRHFPEAEALLARSITFFHLAGEAALASQPMLTLGTMYYYQGDYSRAIEITRRTLDIYPVDQDPRFALCARHNLALCLCEAGEHAEAAEELRAHRGLYERFPDAWTQLRLGWLEGKIAAGLGDAASAEACFVAVRDGFLREGAGYDAEMVCLDLALLYARLGRTAELRQLAEAMHPVFEAGDVHREAIAALLLFQDSARRETLTVEVLEKLASYLRDAQSNPALRFSGVTG
jgi:tetratricopeptide (TPR) repeat protein